MNNRISQSILARLSLIAVACWACGSAPAYEASRGPSELIYWDPHKAEPGYTFIKPQRTAGVYLIDMAGQVVNYWPQLTDAYLMDNGNIFGARGKENGPVERGFVEVDWTGEVLWEHVEKREDYHPHHDLLRIYNPKLGEYTVLYIAAVDMSHEEAIALGADPAARDNYADTQFDAIVEVDRRGRVVWEWSFADHLVQDIDPDKKNHVGENKGIADYPGRLDINWGVVMNDYIHSNGIDYNPATGHLAISSNRTFEVYIIDHDGTFVANDPAASIAAAASSKGDFLYRFGNPANYGQGQHPYYSAEDWYQLPYSGHRQIGGNHDIQWIKEGYPGAGNLLLFNNGMSVPRTGAPTYDPQSEVLEINPYLNAEGEVEDDYVNPPEAGYTTKRGDGLGPNGKPLFPLTRQISNQIVWAYRPWDAFVSFHGSGVQRLKNGNTLVELARPGRLLEITPDGEVVWEYINPVTPKHGIQTTLVTSRHDNNLAGWSPYRYPVTHPGLQGKDLTPKGKISEFRTQENVNE